ncbi:MAG: condensation domain-containing protein [Bacteroidales bacterium]|nr:condensation domain-containing protein [Bacteroidales bacterium]
MLISNTPILIHFKRLAFPVPDHFNQSMMLSSSKRLNVFTLKASLGILCQYHDMLRAVWDGQQLKVRDITAGNLFHLEEHNLKSSSDIVADMLPLCEKLQASVDIANGPMMRVAVFHLPEKDTVLTVIHHLVVDGVSWRVIAEDLNKIYSTLLQGKMSVGLPKRKCSFSQYAQALNEYACSAELKAEEKYWQAVVNKINNYKPDGAKLTNEVSYATFQLDSINSTKLIENGYKIFNADINALLLTALSRAWKEVTGQAFLSVALEGHGREPFGQQPLSLERLVGWFTSVYPVALTYEDGDIRTHVTSIQTMLQAIPNKGFGYGVLARISPGESLECEPLMTFNYLGSFEESGSDGIFTFDNTLPQGSSVSSENRFDTPLSINCAMADGKLSGALSYDKAVLSDSQAQELCKAFAAQLKSLNEQE